MNDHLPIGSGDSRSVPQRRGSHRFDSGGDVAGEEIDLRDIWATLRRRRTTILLTTLGLVSLVAAYSLLVTPLWYSKTLIRVDEEQTSMLNAPALSALTGLQGGGSQIETEMRILSTRPIAEDVVDSLDLNLVVTSPRGYPRNLLFTGIGLNRETRKGAYEIRPDGDGRYRVAAADDETPPLDREFASGDTVRLPGGYFVLANLVEGRTSDGDPLPRAIDFEIALFQEAVEDLTKAMSVGRPDRTANVLQVGYRSTDPALVYAVPNAIAATFISRRNEVQKTEARSTVGFLEDQVEQTRLQLENVEDQLQNFRQGEQIVALGAEAQAQVEQLATLQTQRTQLDAERAALSALLSEIESDSVRPDYRRIAAFPTFFKNDAIGTILEQLTIADQARTNQLLRLTPEHPDVVSVNARIAQLEQQLGSIGRNYLSSLTDQIGALDAEIGRFGARLQEVPERQIRYARIQRQVDMLAELYRLLQTRLKEAEVKEAIDDSSVRVVEAAIRPLEPISPRPVRNIALGTLLGLVIGIVLAFIREYMDKRLHSSDRIEALFGLPTMARIPAIAMEGHVGADRAQALVALDESQSIGAESFRNLRTNVRFVRRGQGAEEIVITSPTPGEGKSLTAANLAVTMGQKGHRVLLIDADLRRPVQHRQFKVPQSPGLSDCLLADELLENALQPTMLGDLFVLPAGQPPPNPAELLDSAQMDRLLDAVRSRFETIILDSPPVLAVTDSAVIAPKTDGVILVVRAEKTDKDAIALAIQQLRQVDAELLGVVVNDAKAEGSYESYYREYYGERRATGGWRRLLARLRGVFS